MPHPLNALLILSSLAASAVGYVPSVYQPDYDLGYDAGYEVGYALGFGFGESVGTSTGTREGKSEGFDDGWSQAYQPAYDASYEESFPVAFDNGFDTAFVIAYGDGAIAGIEYVDELLQTAQDYVAAHGYAGVILRSPTGLWSPTAGGIAVHNGDYGTGPSGAWTTPSNGSLTLTSGIDAWLNPHLGSEHYYHLGYQLGDSAGYSTGYDLGYEAGYGPAYEAAYAVALGDGIEQGTARGLLEGGWDGTNEGWVAGVADGDEAGYAYGFDEGLAGALASLDAAELNAIDLLPLSYVKSPSNSRAPLDPWSLGVVPVPEPSAMLLTLLGGIAMSARRRGTRV